MGVIGPGRNHRQRRATQSLSAADAGIGVKLAERLGVEAYGSIRIDSPVRGEQGSGSGVKKARARPENASAPGWSDAAAAVLGGSRACVSTGRRKNRIV
jgi:hypothetical protein